MCDATYQSGREKCWNGFEEGDGTRVRSLQKVDAKEHEAQQCGDAAAYQTADDIFPETRSLRHCNEMETNNQIRKKKSVRRN